MLKSFRENNRGVLLMLVSSICVCTGQLLWKLSIQSGLWYLIFGFILYAFGAIVMLVAYKFGSLSILQPMLSLNYVFALLLAAFVLGETITITKVVGIAIIFISVVLIGGGDN